MPLAFATTLLQCDILAICITLPTHAEFFSLFSNFYFTSMKILWTYLNLIWFAKIKARLCKKKKIFENFQINFKKFSKFHVVSKKKIYKLKFQSVCYTYWNFLGFKSTCDSDAGCKQTDFEYSLLRTLPSLSATWVFWIFFHLRIIHLWRYCCYSFFPFFLFFSYYRLRHTHKHEQVS